MGIIVIPRTIFEPTFSKIMKIEGFLKKLKKSVELQLEKVTWYMT